MRDAPVVENDLWKWDYRHQVIGVKHLSPTQLFIGVKLVKFLYHLHPRRLWRILTAPDPPLRQQLRFAFWHTAAVFGYEIYEHIADRVRAWQLSRREESSPIASLRHLSTEVPQ